MSLLAGSICILLVRPRKACGLGATSASGDRSTGTATGARDGLKVSFFVQVTGGSDESGGLKILKFIKLDKIDANYRNPSTCKKQFETRS